MAKAKKGGSGGSGMGLIITLIFFVLATVILGVTTYMGYDQIAEKEKATKTAQDAEKKEKDRANLNRLLYHVARTYTGESAGKTADYGTEEMLREKDQYEKGLFSAASAQDAKDKAATITWMKDQDTKLGGWAVGAPAPARTYKQENEALRATIANLKGDLDKEKAKTKTALDDAAAALAKHDTDIKTWQAQVAALKGQAAKDRKVDLDDIRAKTADVDKEGQKLVKLRQELQDEKNRVKTEQDKVKALEVSITKLRAEREQVQAVLDDKSRTLELVLAKTNFDLQRVQATDLTVSAKDKLKNWRKPWEIVSMNAAGDQPYINLGSDDKIKPQLTFSIHGLTTDGKLNPTPKGTLEVVRVIGPKLAKAKITSTADSRKSPIMRGDRLFSATFDPDKKTHVAIAGLIDLDRDGSDTTQKFVKLLQSQNVIVDAFIDASDDRAPKIKELGKGITIDTEYLILAYDLGAMKHAKSRDNAYDAEYKKIKKKLQDAAKENAVKLIRLDDYIEMMGLKPRK